MGKSRRIVIGDVTRDVPFAVDLPSEVCVFLSTWISCSGLSWTVERVKQLKVWAIHILAQDHNYSIPWIKKVQYKSYLIPDLLLFKLLVDSRHNLKVVKLILVVLNSYKQVITGTPSLDSVRTAPVADTKHYARLLSLYVDLPRVPKSVLEPVEAINTHKRYATDSGKTFSGPYGQKDTDYPAEIRYLWDDEFRNPRILGRLVVVPDKGKYRTILVGHWSLQLRTKKFSDWLRQWLWSLPEVASGNQKKMSDFILRELGNSRHLLSIDLSNATDKLSRSIQIELLATMGVPSEFFDFLNLPALYSPQLFGEPASKKLKEVRYTNGQPMGLFCSFPMFELAHYVILKWACATTDAQFSICGDDVVISTTEKDASGIYERYQILVERLGGTISLQKTLKSSNMAEGVGAIFIKGHPKEIRIPSGKISLLEAETKGTWFHDGLTRQCPVQRSIYGSWLTTKERIEYTLEHRRAFNEYLMFKDLDSLSVPGLRHLASHRTDPVSWYPWEDPVPGCWLRTPISVAGEDLLDIPYPDIHEEKEVYRWISKSKFVDRLVSTKIMCLYRRQNAAKDH